MNNLNKIILKSKIKNRFYDILYLIILFLFAYLFNKWFEMLIYYISYSIIRNEFSKAIHGSDFTNSAYKGIKYCRYITLGVQLISLIFIINTNSSKYVNLVLALSLGIINFFAKDYLEYKVLIKHYEKKLKDFNTKPLETLTIEEMKKLMPKAKYDRLEIVYDFLHKPKELRLDIFLDNHYISKATLYRYLSEIKELYEEITREN